MVYSQEFSYKVYKAMNGSEISFKEFMSKTDLRNALKKLEVPCFMVSSKDDPISRSDLIPWNDIRSNSNLIYAYTPKGGHLTFSVGWKRERWYKKIMNEFFENLDYLL